MPHALKPLLLSLTLFFTACAHTESPVGPVSDIIVPRPAPVTLEQPNIMVINRSNIEEFTALVQSGVIIVAMPIEEFNKLLENNQQIIVYMANQNAVIDVYEQRIQQNTK